MTGRRSFTGFLLMISSGLLVAGLWELNWHDVKGTYLVDRARLLSTEGRIVSSSIYTREGRLGKHWKTRACFSFKLGANKLPKSVDWDLGYGYMIVSAKIG